MLCCRPLVIVYIMPESATAHQRAVVPARCLSCACLQSRQRRLTVSAAYPPCASCPCVHGGPTRCPQHFGGHSCLLELVARQDLLPAIDRRRALAPDMAARPRQVTSLARGHRQHTM